MSPKWTPSHPFNNLAIRSSWWVFGNPLNQSSSNYMDPGYGFLWLKVLFFAAICITKPNSGIRATCNSVRLILCYMWYTWDMKMSFWHICDICLILIKFFKNFIRKSLCGDLNKSISKIILYINWINDYGCLIWLNTICSINFWKLLLFLSAEIQMYKSHGRMDEAHYYA